MHRPHHYRHNHLPHERRITRFRSPDAMNQYMYARAINSQQMWQLRNAALYMPQQQLAPGVHPMDPYVYSAAQTRWQRMAGSFPSRISSFGPIMAYPQNPLAYAGISQPMPFGTRARLAARREAWQQHYASRMTLADFTPGAYAGGYPRTGPAGAQFAMADFVPGMQRQSGGGGTRYMAVSTGPEGFTQSVDYRYDGSARREISMTPGNRQRLEQILRTYGRLDSLLNTVREGGPGAEAAVEEISGFFRAALGSADARTVGTLRSILPDVFLRGPGRTIYGWSEARQQFEPVDMDEATALARTRSATDRLRKLEGGRAQNATEEIAKLEKEIGDLEARQGSLENSVSEAEANVKKLQADLDAETKASDPAVKKAQEVLREAGEAVAKAQQAEKMALESYQKQVKGLRNALNALGVPTKEQVEKVEKVIKALDDLYRAQQETNKKNMAFSLRQQEEAFANLQAVQKGQKSRTASLTKAMEDVKRKRGEIASVAARIKSLRSRVAQLQTKIAASE